jgi:hypothetical protein
MMPISSPFRNPSLMSARTAKYVEAMIRHGDSFDYDSWLKKVREEEAQAKQLSAASGSGQAGAAGQIENPVGKSANRGASPRSAPALLSPIPIPRVLSRSTRKMSDKVPKARLRLWLEKVHRACEHFQSSRKRDAVYGYLEAVFAIVTHYRVRRRTNRLLRHGFEFADLPFDRNADPFSAVIRCTSGNTADAKMISKWSRALRYVARSKERDSGLRTFMKEVGGVNACADRYAKCAPDRRQSFHNSSLNNKKLIISQVES